MSRIGRTPISLPDQVNASFQESLCTVNGPKGKLEYSIPPGFNCTLNEGSVLVNAPENSSALHGTVCRIISNMIIGVSQGFSKNLELVGVGYRAELQGSKTLKLSLGHSHPKLYTIPEDIEIVLAKPTQIEVKGIDKQKVGQVCSEIIRFRPPEPYKGKGVRIAGQFIRMKEGKTK